MNMRPLDRCDRLAFKRMLLPLFLIALWGVPTSANTVQKPDILMIVVDDLRPMLGCYGVEHMKTPHIDSLAKRSILFERAYCQVAKCGPSRLSAMTGLRSDSIDVFSNTEKDVKAFRQRRPDAVSIAHWLKKHGYDTRSFGKIDHDGWQIKTDWSVPPSPGRHREMWEVVDADDPSKPTLIANRYACPAIQSPDVPDTHLYAGRMTQEVIAMLRERDAGKPMFLAVGYRRPHLPFVAPKRYFDQYNPDESWLANNPQPPDQSPVMAWFNSDGYGGAIKRAGLTLPGQPNREQAIGINGFELRSYEGIKKQGELDKEEQLQVLQAYAACISYVDAQIGLLIDELKHQDRLDNTLILFWSDHGFHLGEHSAWAKMTNFEVATRVPLLIAAPGISPGKTRELVELVDLYPTLCELAGVPAPKHLEGQSLVGTMRDPKNNTRTLARSQYDRFNGKYMGRAIRTDRYRFVRWTEEKSGRVVHIELYDHQTDPHETQNLANQADQAERIERLTTLLKSD